MLKTVVFYLLLKSVHKNTCKILESEYKNHAKKSVTNAL